MNHQWPPEVIRAMHQFADAAPVAPSLGSVLEQGQIAPSSQPPVADLDPEQRLAPMEEMIVSTTPTSETRNRRRLVMAAAAVVVVVGIAGIAIANNRGDDRSPSATAVSTVAPTTPSHPAGRPVPSSQVVRVSRTSCRMAGTAAVRGCGNRRASQLPVCVRQH